MKQSDFQIEGQRLIYSEFKLNKEFKPGEVQAIEVIFTPEVKYKSDTINRRGLVNLELKIFDKENFEKYPFFILLEIEGAFKWGESIENPDNFLKINAPAILLSYLRSIIIQLTVMAGQPPLNLPLINFSID